MNWRCLLRHKRKSCYGDFDEYCERCGKEFHDPSSLVLKEKTVEMLEKYKNGEIDEHRLYHFIEYMWDEVPWERQYVQKDERE